MKFLVNKWGTANESMSTGMESRHGIKVDAKELHAGFSQGSWYYSLCKMCNYFVYNDDTRNVVAIKMSSQLTLIASNSQQQPPFSTTDNRWYSEKFVAESSEPNDVISSRSQLLTALALRRHQPSSLVSSFLLPLQPEPGSPALVDDVTALAADDVTSGDCSIWQQLPVLCCCYWWIQYFAWS